MVKKLVMPFVTMTLLAGLLAAPADAASCKRLCKKAAKVCGRQYCLQYKGPVRAGCKKGFRLTLVAGCRNEPADYCQQIIDANCAD